MKPNWHWPRMILTGWLLSITGCATSAPKPVYLPEKDRVYLYNTGDTVEADNLICMDHGTYIRTFEKAKEAILTEGVSQ